jgi:hypothetical protein
VNNPIDLRRVDVGGRRTCARALTRAESAMTAAMNCRDARMSVSLSAAFMQAGS